MGRMPAARSAPGALLRSLLVGWLASGLGASHALAAPAAPRAGGPTSPAPAVVAGPANATRRPTEDVVSDFDLWSWKRLGMLTIHASELDRGSVDDLIDRRGYTQARTAEVNPARVTLQFAESQIVRRVVLRPGTPDPYAIACTVVKADGGRFAAGEFVVTDSDAIFRLRDVAVTALELTVERLDRDASVHLAEIRVAGLMSISELVLDDLPETLPEGGSFRVRALGTDAYGGRPDLTSVAQLIVTPTRAVSMIGRDRALVRVGGPLQLAARVGKLQGQPQQMLVSPLGPAPPAPECRPSTTHVEIRSSTPPPFEVLRRDAGEKSARPLGITYGSVFLDLDGEPGAAYQYSIRRVDRFGNPVSASSDEGRVRCLSRADENALELSRVPVLLALYADSLSEQEVEDIVASLEAARLFVYRHTRGRLVLEYEYLRLRGPTPDVVGPSMAGIEADLRDLGIPKSAFAVVHAVSNTMKASYGNFAILGDTGGSIGRGAEVATPPGALGPDPGFAWTFLHEFWHAYVERAANDLQRGPLPSAHPIEDLRHGQLGSAVGRPFDAGEDWDALAALFAGIDFWEELGPPHRLPLTTRDSDADGLPDDDPRLPMDERRWGSDPAVADTDADGLDDLHELTVGLFAGSDPRLADTDGDGSPDGADAQPLLLVSPSIAYGAPQALAAGPDPRLPEVALFAGWTETELALRVELPAPASLHLDLDGSGSLGRWESDVRVGADASDVYSGAARLSLRAFDEPRGVFVGKTRIDAASCEARQLDDGRWAVEVSLPAALGPGARDVWSAGDAPEVAGLRLEAGRVLGLGLAFRPSLADDAKPFEAFVAEQPWTSLFETHRLVDVVLAAP